MGRGVRWLAAGLSLLLLGAQADPAGKWLGRKSVHAPVREGRCEACHAPAGEPSKLNLKPGQLCLDCHQEVKNSLAKEHQHPPAPDCADCHDPHASDEPGLLTEGQTALCAVCHDPEEAELKEKHRGVVPSKVTCSTCHDPHGSEHPALLPGGTQHSALDDCSSCHLKPGADGQARLKGGREICLECHAEVGEDIEAMEVRHKPAHEGKCWDCHSPHASYGRALLYRRKLADNCRACHTKLPLEGHPVVGHMPGIEGRSNPLDKDQPFDCLACHKPHSSHAPGLLVLEKKKFCNACHDQ